MFAKIKNAIWGNKATTAAGATGIVAIVIQVLYTFDADPATNTDWTVVTVALSALLAGMFAKSGVEEKAN